MVTKAKIGRSSKCECHGSFENLKLYFTEYCDNTSIHGLKFIGERGRTIVEKVWWLICLAISLYFCIVLTMEIYHKWQTYPVIVTFATSQTPIWKIPFPSVSICPQIKSQRRFYDFTQEMLSFMSDDSHIDPESAMRFGYMSLVCPTYYGMFGTPNGSEIFNDTVIDFLMEVAPNFEESFTSCVWLGEELNGFDKKLDQIFTRTLTNEGICYTFNLLNRDDIFTNITDFHGNIGLANEAPIYWTIEEGYEEDADLQTFPRRTVLSGIRGGLDLILKTVDNDIDPLCGESVPGYKVLIHHPAETPKASEQYFRVPLNKDVLVSIKPKMMTTSEDIRHYNPEDRQCYFAEEKKLRFFKIYNQKNCLLECLTNFVYQHCGCVAFYMPRDNMTEICGDKMSWCLFVAEGLYLAKGVNVTSYETYNQTRKTPSNSQTNDDCNCLPSCNSLEFETETSQSDWDWLTTLTLLDLTYETNNTHYSRLRISFKDMQFIASERNQLYGRTEFWANCGGLLGLFTGFSFISLMEIIYFLTLRVSCNINKFGRQYWSGARELIEAKDE